MNIEQGEAVWTGDLRTLHIGAMLRTTMTAQLHLVLEEPGLLAKIYRDGVTNVAREHRIAAMVERPPDLPDIEQDGRRFVRIAWPKGTLRDEAGQFLGFLMPALDLLGTTELERVLQERQAREEDLPVGLGQKVVIAANLAATIAALHERGHRVVDLNPSAVRLHRQSLQVAMPDCDGYSIAGFGERYPAASLSSNYLAPEFQEHPVTPEGEESQDCFALAVVIFQLLNFGIHPFAGRPTNNMVPSDLAGRIWQRYYAYGTRVNSGLVPSPTSGHRMMPPDLRSMFDRAFESNGQGRPSARGWANLLESCLDPRSQLLLICKNNEEHQYFNGMTCAACARAQFLETTALNAGAARLSLQNEAAHASRYPGATVTKTVKQYNPIISLANPPAYVPEATPDDAPPVPQGVPKIIQKTVIGVTAIVVLLVGARWAIVSHREKLADEAARQAAGQYVAPVESQPPLRPDPDLAGYPDVQRQVTLTENTARTGARALAKGDKASWDAAMTSLRATAAGHPAPFKKGYRDAFEKYSASVSPSSYDERQRQNLMRDLRETSRNDPYDDEAAAELGWLSLLEGQREAARYQYLHAIWNQPGRADAWYGLAVSASDDDQAVGDMATAELLSADQAGIEHLRSSFPPLLLRLSAVKPAHFAQLQSKAAQIATQNRPVAAVSPVSGATPDRLASPR